MNSIDTYVLSQIEHNEEIDTDWLNCIFSTCSYEVQKKIVIFSVTKCIPINNKDSIPILLTLKPSDCEIDKSFSAEIKIYSIVLKSLEDLEFDLIKYPGKEGLLQRLSTLSSEDLDDWVDAPHNRYLAAFTILTLSMFKNDSTYSHLIEAYFECCIDYALQHHIGWHEFIQLTNSILHGDITNIRELCYKRYLAGRPIVTNWLNSSAFKQDLQRYTISCMTEDEQLLSYLGKETYIQKYRYEPHFKKPIFSWRELLEARLNDTIGDNEIYGDAVYDLLTPEASIEEKCFVAWAMIGLYTETNIKYMYRWQQCLPDVVQPWLNRIESKIRASSKNFDNYHDLSNLREYFTAMSGMILLHMHKKFPLFEMLYTTEIQSHPFNFGYIQNNTVWDCKDGTWTTTSLDGALQIFESVVQQWDTLTNNSVERYSEEMLFM